ncbi:ubiquinone biosynthesis protein COQ4 [Sporobolomyces salmoneus]|uniref:ubiquinone biosynthesis protein COQ4 n=1 Tax=Sporobolomyces salmoneus TaxID=183962 RepID=UPI00317AFBC4
MLACTCAQRSLLRSTPSLRSIRAFSSSIPSHHSPSSTPAPFVLPSSLESPEARTNYPGHVNINTFQRGLLAVGSAVMGLIDTSRHDMIAVLSETSSGPFLSHLRSKMLSTPSGRSLLRERPRITSTSINLDKLSELPPNTFGRKYYDWLKRNRVTPDTRDPVRYIDDPELAYIMQRYRESHDFYHVLLSFGVSLPAELVVKWFELANFSLPVAALSSVFGPLRIEDKEERRRLWKTYGTWAIRSGGKAECLIGVEWEKEWETDIEELRRRLGVEKPPIGFKTFRKEERRLKAEREQVELEQRARAGGI